MVQIHFTVTKTSIRKPLYQLKENRIFEKLNYVSMNGTKMTR